MLFTAFITMLFFSMTPLLEGERVSARVRERE
jgi:hypothetical protein